MPAENRRDDLAAALGTTRAYLELGVDNTAPIAGLSGAAQIVARWYDKLPEQRRRELFAQLLVEVDGEAGDLAELFGPPRRFVDPKQAPKP